MMLKKASPEMKGQLWWGSVEDPRFIVERLQIKKGTNQVFVPRSVYSDLARVTKMDFQKIKGQLRLTIQGGAGSASDGYTCYIYIKGEDVVRRRVESRTFPQYQYEETSYVSKEIPG
jgi:hypothetical protein